MRYFVATINNTWKVIYCNIQLFCLLQLPADQQYHAIGYEPIIDNVDVMHHMLMFGCDDTVTSEQV